MSEITDIDISGVKLTSKAFPTARDMELWQNLTPVEQRAVIVRDENEGFRSGAAPAESVEDRLARVRTT